MKWGVFLLFLVAACIFVLAVPLFFVQLTTSLAKPSELFVLLRLELMTCAFVGALWAVYLKDTRLRANSDNVLVALVVFVIATIFLVVAVIASQLAFSGVDETETSDLARFVGFISLEVFLIGFLTLLSTVFLQTYNQLYNLRTRKFIKYFKPIRLLRQVLRPHKPYEFQMEPRQLNRDNFKFAEHFKQEKELASLRKGASVLIYGKITERVIEDVLLLLLERMRSDETANYVVANRHPVDIWGILEKRDVEKHRKDLVFIDGFSPSFGFFDDTHEQSARLLRERGVACITAKTFAGLHSATNRAFNVIKQNEHKEQRRSVRRPTIMIYDHVSALCDLESFEQFRVYWRHVIPSERSYGMLTIIVEDKLAGDEVLDPLKQLVDFILLIRESEGEVPVFEREK